jgi:2-desacetyl-2-hydroxyethyl bacteriochlorophyllide A dehydrogenase
MKAMVLTAPGALVQDDVSRPAGGPGQVLVRVTHSGICGTDYKIFNGSIPVRYPRIMGHEMVGEVVETGDSDLRSGDKVIIDPELYCGGCFHCRIGQTHLCPKGILLGRDADGGFAEYLTAPSSQVFKLSDGLSIRTAPMIQVLTTCLHAQRQVEIFPGEYVVVLGLGVTGQLHVQLAKSRGATVIGVTRSAEKRALAETLGADVTIPGGDGAVEKVREATEGRGADLVIETTGVVSQLSAGINMTRSGGRVLMFGIITATEGALPFYDLYFKELSLINARVAKGEDYPGAIGLVQRGLVRLEPLVSDVVPLGELNTAVAMLGSGGSGQRMKIILEHDIG